MCFFHKACILNARKSYVTHKTHATRWILKNIHRIYIYMNVFIYIYITPDIWQILTTVTVKKLCEINNKALTIYII